MLGSGRDAVRLAAEALDRAVLHGIRARRGERRERNDGQHGSEPKGLMSNAHRQNSASKPIVP
jgi:hypothetical protein